MGKMWPLITFLTGSVVVASCFNYPVSYRSYKVAYILLQGFNITYDIDKRFKDSLTNFDAFRG